MYNRAFPIGNALFLFAGDMMGLFRLPCGKLPLTFLAVPAGKDRRVECPCQTFDGFIRVRGSVCGLFLFVQTHAPLIVPLRRSRAGKSGFHVTSGARARKFSALHSRFVDSFNGLQASVVMRFHHRFQQEVPQTAPYTLCASEEFSAFVACKRNPPAAWEDISSGSRYLPEYAERRLPVQNK